MHEIEMHQITEEFANCWQTAGLHLARVDSEAHVCWLKSYLMPPFLEHLSFRIGNQLFFVRIEDASGGLEVPGSGQGLMMIARGCAGHACLMPMQKKGEMWEPVIDGWGMIDPQSRREIDPVNLVTDEEIEMTDWELQDFAVQIVRTHIEEKLGFQIMSSNGNPNVDPSIWFVGNNGPEWVVVRAARYPQKAVSIPDNIDEISRNCARLGNTGHYASVPCASTDEALNSTTKIDSPPIIRGQAIHIEFDGFAPNSLQ